MTDSRITRIVDQLADLSDEEMQNLVETINTKRAEKKKEKQEKAIEAFKVAFCKLIELDVDVRYSDNEDGETTLYPDDILFRFW